MKTKIFHGVNSSLFLYYNGFGTLVDGLHRGEEVNFSLMPEQQLRDLEQHRGIFGHTDQILFTHLHVDHFDRALLCKALDANPSPLVYGPGLDLSNTNLGILAPDTYEIGLNEAQCYAITTIHDGEEFEHDFHQSLLLLLGEERFFLAGDAKFKPQEANRILELAGGPITAGFFNLYQLWSIESTAFIQALAPERIYLNHMPLPDRDPFGYHRLSRQILRRLPSELPVPVMLAPMSWVDDSPPNGWI